MERAELEALAAQKMAQEEQQTNGAPSRQELEALALEKMASEEAAPKVNPFREANLGIINRARYSIEPLQSNRKALLVQEYGQENVQEDDKGNLWLKQNNEIRPINREGLSMADVAEFAGALPELSGAAVGLIGGAVAGAPAAGVGAIPAAIAGGAAGGALGSAARQALSAGLATPQVAGAGERASEVLLSGGIGGIAGGAGAAIKPALPAIKSGLSKAATVFKRGAEKVPGYQTAETLAETGSNVFGAIKKNFSLKPAPDSAELLNIADTYGIEREVLPEAVEFGKGSAVSRASRAIAEGPLGEKRLENFAKAQSQITSAIDDQISGLTPKRLTSAQEAGQYLVDSINDASKTFFGNLDETYKSLAAQNPELRLSNTAKSNINKELDTIRSFAIKRSEMGIGSQKQEARSLLQAVNALKKATSVTKEQELKADITLKKIGMDKTLNTNQKMRKMIKVLAELDDTGKIEDVVDALRNIGEEAFKKGPVQNRLPIDRPRLQELYHKIQKEVVGTFREEYGDDAADSLLRNNKMISDFLGQNSVISKAISSDTMAPETIFKSLVSSGDTKKIEALKALLPPEKLQALKASFLDAVVKKNSDGNVMFKATANNLQRKKELINSLFNTDELRGINDLLRLGDRMGEPVLSSSGTGASNAFNDFFRRIGRAATSEAKIELMKKRGRAAVEKEAEKFTRKAPFRERFVSPKKNYSGYANVLTDESQRKWSEEKE
jgi:hypothetical protein